MNIESTGFKNANLNVFKNNDNNQVKNGNKEVPQEKSVEEHIEESAFKVSLSMNAQIILFAMDSSKLSEENLDAQKGVLDFLSGKDVKNGLSLKDLGYEGKAITELSVKEAEELISDEGFFGAEQTSQRVAQFVFNFSNDDIELLQKGREGVVQGFEEADKLWGGELPQVSYDTQTKTLALIDEKIATLTSLQSEKV